MVVIRVEFLALLAAVAQMVVAQKAAYAQCRLEMCKLIPRR